MEVRITGSTVQRYGGPLVRSVGHARITHVRRDGLLLKLYANGEYGLGEASPLPGFSPESIEACEHALCGIHEALGVITCEVPLVEHVTAVMKRLGSRFTGLPSARFAVETAVFDLVGRLQGLSVARCLTPDVVYRRVPLCGLLGSGTRIEEFVDGALALLAQGVSTLKVKVGRKDIPFAQEIATLMNLRREVRSSFALRLDANGAWDVSQARDRLAQLAAVSPELVEEPVSGDALLELGPCAVPWAADESLTNAALSDAILNTPGCAAVVLKPALLGGLTTALDLGRRAQRAGRGVVVTHLFDGPVGLAAACELALAFPEVTLACGLVPHDGLSAWPRVNIRSLTDPGYVVAVDVPGLGIESEALDHVR